MSIDLCQFLLKKVKKKFRRKFQIVRDFLMENDDVKRQRAWNEFYGQTLSTVRELRKQALKAAGSDVKLVESVKKDWKEIQGNQVKIQFELKKLIDSVRVEALQKAQIEYNQFAQTLVQLWEIFSKVPVTGDSRQARGLMVYYENTIRHYGIAIRQKIASSN